MNALDAAMPFDFESRAAAQLKAEKSLKIGIVGFGTFGQFLARRMVKQGHEVCSVNMFKPLSQVHDPWLPQINTAATI